jgi:hypothetical protein
MSVTPAGAPVRPAYIRDSGTGLYYQIASQGLPGSGGGEHGLLLGLTDDDHLQYHNDARGDARYSLLAHTHPSPALTSAIPTPNTGWTIGSSSTAHKQDRLVIMSFYFVKSTWASAELVGTMPVGFRPIRDMSYSAVVVSDYESSEIFILANGRIEVARARPTTGNGLSGTAVFFTP